MWTHLAVTWLAAMGVLLVSGLVMLARRAWRGDEGALIALTVMMLAAVVFITGLAIAHV